MSLLLPFTFRQQETIHYYECLEIWAKLLDYFIAQQQVVLDSYTQPMLGLANGIVMSTAKYQVVVEDYFEQVCMCFYIINHNSETVKSIS